MVKKKHGDNFLYQNIHGKIFRLISKQCKIRLCVTMSSNLPIKILKENLNQPVIVRLKGGKTIRGILSGYDEHLNLTLKDAEFIMEEETEKLDQVILRGDNVVFISPP